MLSIIPIDGFNAKFFNDIVNYSQKYILSEDNCLTVLWQNDRQPFLDSQVIMNSVSINGSESLTTFAKLAETQATCIVAIANANQVRL